LSGAPPRPAGCRDAADVTALNQHLYGSSLAEDAGVLHVTALFDAGDGPLRTLKINEHTPKSEHDFFALNLARARADAIFVTGRVLRSEPELRYSLQGAGELPAALAAWRREVAGRHEPPQLVVLTSGRGLDLAHPAFHSWARPLVFTGDAGAPDLAAQAEREGVEVVAHGAPSLRAALEWARSGGARTLSVEAGPSTASALYDEPLAVDELMLSIFEGQDVPEAARGAPLRSREQLEERLGAARSELVVEEASGPWRLARFSRR
jgi:riboflavin biosynthesis pyrimidine reductase